MTLHSLVTNAPIDAPHLGDFDDEEACNYDTGTFDKRKIKMPCPGCGRVGSPLCSSKTKETDGGWRWVGQDHREPYSTWLAHCRCGQSYRFTIYTPQ